MAIFRVFSFLLVLLGSFLPSCLHAQHIEQLFDEQSTLDLSDSLYFLFETDYQLTIGDVSRRRSDFLMHPHDNPNFGFRNNGMWLLTSVTNVSNDKHWVFSINFSQLDSVDFYLVKDGKVISQSHQGKAQKEQRFRVPTFRVELPNSDPVDLYIRIESHSSSLIAPLLSPAARSATTQRMPVKLKAEGSGTDSDIPSFRKTNPSTTPTSSAANPPGSPSGRRTRPA